ncbi:MAG: hypothetical protein JWP12_60 [Bacteroidetes bacterium]|nr:hypothetical protein [Bacteroidota bacterium]
MKTEKNNIRLKFNCNQDWEAMKVTACGRYCDVCNKEVIDFTTRSRKEFQALTAGKTDLCGRFAAEQIDLSLIKPITISAHRKAFLFISTIAVSLFSKPSRAASIIHPTEQVYTGKNSSGQDAVFIPTVEHDGKFMTTKPNPDKPFMTTKKRKYYWSKRFPFIRIRRQMQLMGKF